jgi:phage protein D
MPEQDVGLLSVYTAQPTVRVAGQVVDQVRDLLVAMEIHEQEGGLSRLELRLINVESQSNGTATLAFDTRDFDLGKDIAIYTGDENVPVEIFRGVITGLESEFPDGSHPEFIVLAEDALQKARFARRSKYHDNLGLSDLMQSIASATGVTKGAAPPTSAGGQMQLNESDLAFFRRLMGRYDLDAQISAKELQGQERQNIRRNEVTLDMHSQLSKARVVADLSHQATEVTISGWDPKQGQKVTASSKGKNAGPGQGRNGPQILKQAIGDRSEHIGHLAIASGDEAQAVVDSAFDQRARGFVTLHGTAEGNPKIRVGTHLTVTGLGKRFDNTYYVRHAVHRFDLTDGYQTDFTAECAFLGNV